MSKPDADQWAPAASTRTRLQQQRRSPPNARTPLISESPRRVTARRTHGACRPEGPSARPLAPPGMNQPDAIRTPLR